MLRKQPSFIQLQEHLLQQNAREPLVSLYRNMGFGSAALCLVLLVGIAQIEATSIALNISVFGAALALPLWILFGVIYEYYLVLGKRSYGHLNSILTRVLVLSSGVCGCVGLSVSTMGVIYYLSEDAFWVFLWVGCAGLLSFLVFHIHIAYWWYAPDGPGSTEVRSPDSPGGT